MALTRTCDNCGKEITPFGYVQVMDYGVGGEGGGSTELCPDCAGPIVNVKAVKEGLKKDRKRREVPNPGKPIGVDGGSAGALPVDTSGEMMRGDVTEAET